MSGSNSNNLQFKSVSDITTPKTNYSNTPASSNSGYNNTYNGTASTTQSSRPKTIISNTTAKKVVNTAANVAYNYSDDNAKKYPLDKLVEMGNEKIVARANEVINQKAEYKRNSVEEEMTTTTLKEMFSSFTEPLNEVLQNYINTKLKPIGIGVTEPISDKVNDLKTFFSNVFGLKANQVDNAQWIITNERKYMYGVFGDVQAAVDALGNPVLSSEITDRIEKRNYELGYGAKKQIEKNIRINTGQLEKILIEKPSK